MARRFRPPIGIVLMLMAPLALGGCRGAQTSLLADIQRQASKTLAVSSAAFKENATIPTRHTCSGEDISPALAWSGAPETTNVFALVFDDLDAGNPAFTHWLLANLPSSAQSMAENLPRDPTLPDGSIQGQNGFGKVGARSVQGRCKVGYGGPCPPPGDAHHYHFAIYALDATLWLQPGYSQQQLASATQRHTFAWGKLVGLFARS